VIIESIKSKKGKEIVSIDLKAIEKSVCNYFVICHAESTTQVSAIAEEIRQKTKEDLEVSADHVEGLQKQFLDFIGLYKYSCSCFHKRSKAFLSTGRFVGRWHYY
jgi:ribosome-associated protein